MLKCSFTVAQKGKSENGLSNVSSQSMLGLLTLDNIYHHWWSNQTKKERSSKSRVY